MTNKKPTNLPTAGGKPQNEVVSLLSSESFKKQLGAALPKHMTPERMARIALTEFRKTPLLQSCHPMSFAGAIMQAAQLGLEPGGALGHCYLIPFKNKKRGTVECNMIIGYRGMIELAGRSGRVSSIWAHVVKEKDQFAYELGLEPSLVHRPATGGDRGETIAVYAVARMQGGPRFEVMDISEVEKIRKMQRYPNPVWDDHYDEMARKTVVRRLFKYLPVSIDLREAMRLEEVADQARSQGLQQLVDPNYVPAYEGIDDTTIAAEIERGENEYEAQRLEVAEAEFLAVVDETVELGIDRKAILKALDLKSFDGLDKLGAAKLDALNELLRDWRKEQLSP